VYEAADPQTGQTLAVKLVRLADFPADDHVALRERFRDAAQAAATLVHPNIVKVYECGEEAGLLYVTMQYLHGRSMAQLMTQESRPPLWLTIPLVEQVGRALDYAHAQKVVHGDVKPANVMLLNNGTVKVTDFRLGKSTLGVAGRLSPGSPYASPEQVRGEKLDGRSDVFSLGAVLYELITGEKAFPGANPSDIAWQTLEPEAPSARSVRPEIAPGLDYVVRKALAKQPDARYESCAQLVDDLKNHEMLEVPAPAPEPARPRPVVTAPTEAVPREASAAEPAFDSSAAKPEAVAVSAARQDSAAEVPGALIGDSIAPRRKIPIIWLVPLALTVFAVIFVLALFHNRGSSPPASIPPQASVPARPGAADLAPSRDQGSNATQPPEQAAVPSPVHPEVQTSSPDQPPSSSGDTSPLPPPSGKGNLVVTADVNNAQVVIDGNHQPDWITPRNFVLSPGPHRVAVVKQGYETAFQVLNVQPGGTSSMPAELANRSGELQLVTDPAGLEVSVDGKPLGRTPISVTLARGTHRYHVTGPPGKPPAERTFTLRGGDVLRQTEHW
jgi:serine/threonine protein kinase